MKKRILAFLLALCMIASLAACSGADDMEEPDVEPDVSADEPVEPAEEAPAENAGSWSSTGICAAATWSPAAALPRAT